MQESDAAAEKQRVEAHGSRQAVAAEVHAEHTAAMQRSELAAQQVPPSSHAAAPPPR
jgi:hypothetical protein